MQVSVESGEGLQRHLLVDIPAEPVQAAIDEKLKEIASEVRVDGFRPGKVPLRIVKQRFYNNARQDVVNDLLESSFVEALEQQAFQAAGRPTAIDERKAVEKGGFSYTATIEIIPEVNLQDLTEQTLVNRESELTEADIDATLLVMRKDKQIEVDVDRPAEPGDTVYIDYVGKVDGEDFYGNTAENKSILLGSGDENEPFENALIGARVGDELTIQEKLDKWAPTDVVGKIADYAVKVIRVTTNQLPELDEAFVKALDVEDGTEASLRAEVTHNLERELQRRLMQSRKDAAFGLLKKVNPLEVPRVLVEAQAGHLREQLLDEWQIPENTRKKIGAGLGLEHFTDRAEQQVRLQFLVEEIVKEQSLQVSEDELRTMAHELSKPYKDPEKFIEDSLREQQSRETLRNLILEQKVVDWIYQQAQIENQTVTFDELKNPPVEETVDEEQKQLEEAVVDEEPVEGTVTDEKQEHTHA